MVRLSNRAAGGSPDVTLPYGPDEERLGATRVHQVLRLPG